MTRFVTIALLACVLACYSKSPTVGATCESACANLARRGCSAGAVDAGCVSTCGHAPTDLQLACLTDAGDIASIEACGTVRCR